jgi:hypothetical protein
MSTIVFKSKVLQSFATFKQILTAFIADEN